jgi:hypothetical protein
MTPSPVSGGKPQVTGVRPPGFEPGTCGLRVRCSAVELEARLEVQPYPAQAAPGVEMG